MLIFNILGIFHNFPLQRKEDSVHRKKKERRVRTFVRTLNVVPAVKHHAVHGWRFTMSGSEGWTGDR